MPFTSIKVFEATESPTPAERALIEGCQNNGQCFLGDRTLPPEGPPNPNRHIRAELIRLIALGGTPGCGLHPSGIWLEGAHITGTLDLRYLKTRGRCVLITCRFDQQPNLDNAELAQLNLSGSHLPGVFAQGLSVKGSVFLRKLTTKGTVNLNSAKISGQLVCNGADLDGNGGASLNVQGADVTGDIFMTNLIAKGTVRLSGAKIGGQLACEGAKLDGDGKQAFNGQRMQVAAGFIFRDLKSVRGQVYLGATHVSDLADDADSWSVAADELYLNGFTYDRIGGSSPLTLAARRNWLARGSRFKGRFHPQPYTQFAKVLREMGHNSEARKVLFAREEALAAAAWDERQARYIKARNGDQSSRADMGKIFWEMWSARIWSGIIRRIAGYGYKPHWPMYWLVGLIGLTYFLALIAWHAGDFAPNSAVVLTSPGWTEIAAQDCDHIPAPCDANPASTWSGKAAAGMDWDSFSPLGYAADLVIPILVLGQTDAWAPSKDRGPLGKLLWWGRWVLIAAGWIVSALGAAAVTGIIQRDRE